MNLAFSHRGVVRFAVIAISIGMALYPMWAIAFGTPEAILFRGTHLLFALVLVFLLYRLTAAKDEGPVSDEQKQADSRLPTPLDYALLIVAAAPIIYLFVNY